MQFILSSCLALFRTWHFKSSFNTLNNLRLLFLLLSDCRVGAILRFCSIRNCFKNFFGLVHLVCWFCGFIALVRSLTLNMSNVFSSLGPLQHGPLSSWRHIVCKKWLKVVMTMTTARVTSSQTISKYLSTDGVASLNVSNLLEGWNDLDRLAKMTHRVEKTTIYLSSSFSAFTSSFMHQAANSYGKNFCIVNWQTNAQSHTLNRIENRIKAPQSYSLAPRDYFCETITNKFWYPRISWRG